MNWLPAGAPVAVGRAELTVDQVAGLLEHGDRTQGGVTAPAAGLTFVSVTY